MQDVPLPCPFCGEQLIKKHNCYIAVDKTKVEYDYWEHPANDCVLSDRCSEEGDLYVYDIPYWNRRANNV